MKRIISSQMVPHYLERIDLVQFKDYSFSYPGAERKSLSGIDWTIQKGQTVGIVGRTGAGKTTLVRQFLRQYPVGEGEVFDQPATDRGLQPTLD